ncbi:MAG: HIT family protein [Nanoarchaeota archaeon]
MAKEKKLTQAQLKKLQEEFQKLPPEKKAELVEKQCLFCQIAQGKIESTKVYEDSDVIAILDIIPASPGHTLVIPKRHYQFFFQIPPSTLGRISEVAAKISTILIDTVKAHGLNLHAANGTVAGQRVPHFHLHLIPRFEDDGISFEWQGQKVEKKDLEKIAKQVSEKLKQDKMTAHENEKAEKSKQAEESDEMRFLRRKLDRIP